MTEIIRSRTAISVKLIFFLDAAGLSGSHAIKYQLHLPEVQITWSNRVPEVYGVIRISAEHSRYEKVIRIFECMGLGRFELTVQ